MKIEEGVESLSPEFLANKDRYKNQVAYLMDIFRRTIASGNPDWNCRIRLIKNGTVSQSLRYRGVRFYIKYSSRFGWRLIIGSEAYNFREVITLKNDFSQLIGRPYSAFCRDVGNAIWKRDYDLARKLINDFFG